MIHHLTEQSYSLCENYEEGDAEPMLLVIELLIVLTGLIEGG